MLGIGSSSGNTNNNDFLDEDIELQSASEFNDSSKDDQIPTPNYHLSTSSLLSSIFESLHEITERQQEEEQSNLLQNKFKSGRNGRSNKWKYIAIVAVLFAVFETILVLVVNSKNRASSHHGSGSHVTPSPQIPSSTATSVIPTSTSEPSASKKRKISMADYRNGNFYVFKAPFEFIGDSKGLLKQPKNYLLEDFNDGSVTKLFDTLDFEFQNQKYHIQSVIMSPQQDKLLLVTNSIPQWRHSSVAHYWIYDIGSTEIVPLYDADLKISNAQWSPLGKFITFVYKNDLYIREMAVGEVSRLTTDGSANIFNGKPDWVYEEEVLSTDNSVWWAPDDSNVLFMKLDDTEVPVYNLEFFVQQGNEKYPIIEELKYPRPGFDNPEPKLIVLNTDTGDQTELPESDFGAQFILYQLYFITADEIIYKETDRESNVMNVNLYSLKDKQKQKLRQINASDYGGWIEKPGPFVPVNREGQLGYIDRIVSENYNHLLYFKSYKDSEPYKILTKGKFDIVDNYNYNNASDEVYLISTLAEDPLSHHLYKISLKDFQMKPLTDDSSPGYYDITFNKDASLAVLNYEGPELPFQKVVKLSEFTMELYKKLPMLNNNLIPKAAQKNFDIPTTHYRNLTIDGVEFQYIEVRPTHFDSLKKYPLLVNIYGGPGSVKLSSEYNVGFEHVVSSSLDLVTIYLDPRGTGGKGWDFKKYANKKMGYWEPRDITSIIKTLMSQKNYLDTDRTAIWGWSYGGFTTLKTLEFDKGEVFKYGMAVAPVTNWEFYDSVYTERYMDLPENNEAGYKESKINEISNFKSVKRFLIMHGTGDDNVHLQNTLKLLDEFDLKSVENYDMHLFPDSNHSIYYNNANTIVYDKLFQWLEKAFSGKFK